MSNGGRNHGPIPVYLPKQRGGWGKGGNASKSADLTGSILAAQAGMGHYGRQNSRASCPGCGAPRAMSHKCNYCGRQPGV